MHGEKSNVHEIFTLLKKFTHTQKATKELIEKFVEDLNGIEIEDILLLKDTQVYPVP